MRFSISSDSCIILRSHDNRFDVFLIDFGAVANPQVQGGGFTVAGSYGYMPPEQLTGHPFPESDTYSLAATLVHLLSGTSPANMEFADFRLIIDPHLEAVPRAVICILNDMLDSLPREPALGYRNHP